MGAPVFGAGAEEVGVVDGGGDVYAFGASLVLVAEVVGELLDHVHSQPFPPIVLVVQNHRIVHRSARSLNNTHTTDNTAKSISKNFAVPLW